MLKKVLITTAIALQSVSFCFAQTAPTPPAPIENPHQSQHKKVRDCKKQAADQQLTGEERRTFIAQCVKK
jgi:hypothetical protein